MPGPYSTDLRKRVIRAHKRGRTYEQIAADFDIGEATVSRWLRRYRERGDVQPARMGGRRAKRVKLSAAGLEALKELVDAQPDLTLDELADQLEPTLGHRVSAATILRGLLKLGYSRKKKSLVATEATSERVAKLRERFSERQKDFDPVRLVFIDETGTHVGMTRTYGRSAKGQAVADTAPRNYGEIITVIGAMTIGGLEAIMTVNGGTTTGVFLAFVEQVLAPVLIEGDIVVLDNLGAHRSPAVRAALKELGASVVYLPPYSPDMNPIEWCWSKLKTYLRSAKARSRTALDRAIAQASEWITPLDAGGWFKDAGYTPST